MADANVATRFTQLPRFILKPTLPRLAQEFSEFDGAVAADALDHVNVITSPTQSWIPQPPIISHREITTFSDGWWGPQEYTRWPQMFNESVFHHACIPLRDTPYAPGHSVYDILPADFFLDSARGLSNPYECETPGFGRVGATTLAELRREAVFAIDKLKTAEMKARARRDRFDNALGSVLRIMLRNAVDRLEHLPCTETHALVTVRMAHRLILEICGLSVYYDVVTPRIANPTPQGTYPLLRVRGGLVRNGAAAQLLYRLGIPFWFIQRFRPDIFVRRVVPMRPWTDVLDSNPLGMKVPKSWYDADGTNQDSARWVHPSLMYVCSTLCSARLPRLEDVVARNVDEAPVAKKHKGPSGLPTQQEETGGSSSKAKKTRRGGKKHHAQPAQPRLPHPAFAYQPPPSDILADTSNWRHALNAASPLPHPPSKAAYIVRQKKEQLVMTELNNIQLLIEKQ
ncbi:hypothetical protein FOMPIDRAFT_1020841 [Fomitopsis schrenkii]|uniref:Uncharacterized protein n=1 Tax=Fomitopsis schrenkii TaxID=2126942 RepID=S8F1I4_FOMSC|nr:hypothetical protein FOMPIDRAFT_1020841 [Fomitopsis schrenkii]